MQNELTLFGFVFLSTKYRDPTKQIGTQLLKKVLSLFWDPFQNSDNPFWVRTPYSLSLPRFAETI